MSNKTAETKLYTPGPWHWDCDPVKDDPLGRVRYRVCALGRTITQVYYTESKDGGQARADTLLLAAAPEMYEALKASIRWIETAMRGEKSVYGEGPTQKIVTAILKAEGRA